MSQQLPWREGMQILIISSATAKIEYCIWKSLLYDCSPSSITNADQLSRLILVSPGAFCGFYMFLFPWNYLFAHFKYRPTIQIVKIHQMQEDIQCKLVSILPMSSLSAPNNHCCQLSLQQSRHIICLSNLWRRKWQPTPVFLPGKSYGQRSLEGYSHGVAKGSDVTEWLSTHTHTHKIMYLESPHSFLCKCKFSVHTIFYHAFY